MKARADPKQLGRVSSALTHPREQHQRVLEVSHCPLPYALDAGQPEITEIAPLLLKPLDEPLQHLHPVLVLADLVLDAVLEVGVVVDLHHDEACVGLLDVDPLEPLADRAGGAPSGR
jgi:hypothetical protein